MDAGRDRRENAILAICVAAGVAAGGVIAHAMRWDQKTLGYLLGGVIGFVIARLVLWREP